MIDRLTREQALDELACAIAESTIDSWLDGALEADGLGLDTYNNTGNDHETASKGSARKANARKVRSTPNKKRAE